MQRNLERYNRLKTLIEERMIFEKDVYNQKKPYLTHQTTYNFKDEHGCTLLYYASILNDAEYISYLIGHGANIDDKYQDMTPIQIALCNGNIEAAKVLALNNTDLYICARTNVHANCIDWYRERNIELILNSLPNIKIGDFTTFSDLNKSLFMRYFIINHIIEEGLIDEVKQSNDPRLSEEQIIEIALSNAHFELADYLIERFHNNNIDKFYEPMFMLVALSKRLDNLGKDDLQFLLKKGASLSYKKTKYSYPPLLLACINNKSELITFMLDNNADITPRDLFNNTIVHIAVKNKNYDLLTRLTNHPEYIQICKTVNIYGDSPIDLATQMGDETALSIILNDSERINMKSVCEFGVEAISISQINILNTLHYFLELHYRDTDLLEINGHCNGFTFLRNLYSKLHGSEYFYETMSLIRSWDGTSASLNKDFDIENTYLKNFGYRNLYELIEQWCNDIIWFQASFGRKDNGLPFWGQLERTKYFEVVSASDKMSNISVNYIFNNYSHVAESSGYLPFCDHSPASIEMLIELLTITSKLPAGVLFEISGSQHIVTGQLKSNGNFEYYDPNLDFKIPDASISELAHIIFHTKYVIGNKLTKDGRMNEFVYSLSYISGVENQLHGFKIFDETALPKCMEDAVNYHLASPCGFTQLHVCMVAGSVESFKEIIELGYYDLTAVDYTKTNVCTMAAAHPNGEFLKILLAHIKDISFNDLLHGKSNYEPLKQYINNLTHDHKRDILFKALNSTNTNFIIELLNDNPQLLNAVDEDGRPFIAMCCRDRKYEVVEYLLEYKVSIYASYHNKDTKDKATPLRDLFYGYDDKPPPDSLLEKLEINHLDDSGYALLHHACKYKYPSSTNKILKFGANPNSLTASGLTPLQILLESKSWNKEDIFYCVKALLKHNADPKMGTNKYRPIDLATKNNLPDCAKLIKTYLITDYINYLNKSSTPMYRHQYTMFGRVISYGASKEQEIEAGMAYLKFLNGSIDDKQLEPFKKILSYGNFRSITKK